MVEDIRFYIDTDLATGLVELVKKLGQHLDLKEPLKMIIAGGMATHLYTAGRVTMDVDAEFSKRFLIPPDFLVETAEGNVLFLDASYNSTFALMHEDYQQDAIRVPVDTDHIDVYVLGAVDLIVSKIARFSGPDRGDIENLISHRRVTAEEIERRATEALGGYVGNMSAVKLNLEEVLQIARDYNQVPDQKSE
ncbi:DUF6036 family nucleotidyltransferase [Glaciimonas immobilis]|uniref:DUF6036 domain-containing protein n=1 Tax=Glaciimonas immobilis TaxID=728004 RepID=A0A840RYQ3_9BURK|nr:DUF6036 family nucleotidyltransferase [Glaciimonas immobilis]KAF3997214.1 hypothetical protein HAV38_16295 [Glaciimonas immobilis]MBB5202258.1 hypothetical protein [Glaciimonas immobilis]